MTLEQFKEFNDYLEKGKIEAPIVRLFTQDEVEAMLTDLSMKIGEIEDGYTEFDEENERSLTMIPLESVDRLIQEKINALKAESEPQESEDNND